MLCVLTHSASAEGLPDIQFKSAPKAILPAIQFGSDVRRPSYAEQAAAKEATEAVRKKEPAAEAVAEREVAKVEGKAIQLTAHLQPVKDCEPQLLPADGDTGRVDRNPFRWKPQKDRMAFLQQESPADRGVGEWTFKPMTSLGTDIALPSGELPSMVFHEKSGRWQGPCECSCCPRGWAPLCYCFAATCFYHNPLYFEEVNLERYGYGCNPCLQPAASAAHFFVRVPMLPYLMATDCPGDCDYTLGHYRPGSCAPWRRHCVPLNTPGSLAQTGAIVGLVFLLP